VPLLARQFLGLAEEPAQLREQLSGRRATSVERIDPVEAGEHASFVHELDASGALAPGAQRLCHKIVTIRR
jgi:hypothetical protein